MAEFTLLKHFRGPSKIAIYNEKFIPLAMGAHPTLMGRSLEEGYPGIWDAINVIFAQVETSALTADVKEQQMFVERNGFVEEVYFEGSFIPLRNDEGNIGGFYNSAYGKQYLEQF